MMMIIIIMMMMKDNSNDYNDGNKNSMENGW